jgi:hypothetical protein
MEATFSAYYDAATSTLELSGSFEPAAWAALDGEVDRAYRRSALRLTVDLTRAREVPPHAVGELVHLCNCRYPGTLVLVARPASRRAPERPVARAA